MAEKDYLGVSAPISSAQPTPLENELSEKLLTELKLQKNFEPPEATKKREEILNILNQLTVKAVQLVGKKKGLPASILADAGGKISTFGSYRLGVFGPGSDIDALMLAPKHMSRDDFFEYVPDLIRKTFKSEDITELVPVPDAFVPIIKAELRGVSVDLIFCSLQRSSVPKNMDLKDQAILRGLSEVDLRAVNGTRVTDRILELVPQTRTFRIAIRAVKLWAQRRGMYGNIVGFPGGVAWAMMLARTCQLWPQAAPAKLVEKFFWLMGEWSWPSPVRLQKREDGDLSLPEWDPNTDFRARYHKMPVITPAYPTMNSTANVTDSTFKLILKELKRGHAIVTDIMAGKKLWKHLFERHSFFTKDYKHYLIVISASRSKDAQQKWCGLVQSRVRRLVTGIEKSQANSSVDLAHPYNKSSARVHECRSDVEIEMVQDGSLDFQVKESKMADTNVQAQAAAQTDAAGGDVTMQDGTAETKPETKSDGTNVIYSDTFYIGIGLKPDAKSLDISMPIADFKRNCLESPLYDDNMMSLRIKHVRSYDLPADVFVDGEIRPTRPKKTKAAKAALNAQAMNGKRSTSDANLDENENPAKRRQSANGNATPNSVAATPSGSTPAPVVKAG